MGVVRVQDDIITDVITGSIAYLQKPNELLAQARASGPPPPSELGP